MIYKYKKNLINFKIYSMKTSNITSLKKFRIIKYASGIHIKTNNTTNYKSYSIS